MIGIKVCLTFYALGEEARFNSLFATSFFYLNEGKKWGEVYPIFFNNFYQGKVKIKDMDAFIDELDSINKKLLKIKSREIIWDFDSEENIIPLNIQNELNVSKHFMDIYRTEKGTPYFEIFIKRAKECKELGWDLLVHNMFKRPDMQPQADQSLDSSLDNVTGKGVIDNSSD